MIILIEKSLLVCEFYPHFLAFYSDLFHGPMCDPLGSSLSPIARYQ